MADERAQAWESINWQPKDLKVGDRAGLLVSGHGAVTIVQNDCTVCRPACKINPDRPLLPLVDLLGNTQGVSLIVGAQPPVAFHRALSGGYVTLSDDGLSATHQDPTGHELKGVAFLRAPIPVFEEGYYFEVRVDEVCTGNPDGLTIGVTTKLPCPLDPEPATADDVPESWSIGYDGLAKAGGEMTDVRWRPCELAVGDRVGLFVDCRGLDKPYDYTSDGGEQEISLFVNGQFKSQVPGKLPPANCPLYGFVDLLGNTTKASLLEGAVPPSVKDPQRRPEADSFQQGLLGSMVSMIASVTQSSEVLSSFNREMVSPFVHLSKDGVSATHKAASDEDMQGVLFGDAPLPRFPDDSQYFEVRVDSVCEGFPDGLVIGVARELPDFKPLCCADEVPSSWSFGYDGGFTQIPCDGDEVNDPVEPCLTFRKQDSLYRVSRFSQSAFHVSAPQGQDGLRACHVSAAPLGQDDDDDDDDEMDHESAVAPARSGRKTVVPVTVAEEESPQDLDGY